MTSGRVQPSCSAISYPSVFFPSSRYGSRSVDRSNQSRGVVVLAHRAAAGRDVAAHEVDRRRRGRPPRAGTAPACPREGTDRPRARPARRRPPQRSRRFRPTGGRCAARRSARAIVIAVAMPRALNEPVGFSASSLRRTVATPSDGPSEAQREERGHPLARGVTGSPSPGGPRRSATASAARGDRARGHRARGLFEAIAREEDRRRTGRGPSGAVGAVGDVAARALEPLEGGGHGGMLRLPHSVWVKLHVSARKVADGTENDKRRRRDAGSGSDRLHQDRSLADRRGSSLAGSWRGGGRRSLSEAIVAPPRPRVSGSGSGRRSDWVVRADVGRSCAWCAPPGRRGRRACARGTGSWPSTGARPGSPFEVGSTLRRRPRWTILKIEARRGRPGDDATAVMADVKVAVRDVSPADQGLPYEDVTFRNADGLTLRGWYLPPPAEGVGRAPAIAYGHGNATDRRHWLAGRAGRSRRRLRAAAVRFHRPRRERRRGDHARAPRGGRSSRGARRAGGEARDRPAAPRPGRAQHGRRRRALLAADDARVKALVLDSPFADLEDARGPLRSRATTSPPPLLRPILLRGRRLARPLRPRARSGRSMRSARSRRRSSCSTATRTRWSPSTMRSRSRRPRGHRSPSFRSPGSITTRRARRPTRTASSHS